MDNKRRKLYALSIFILALCFYFLFFVEGKHQLALSQQKQVSAIPDEYYPYHPTGCRYIKKLNIERVFDYYFIQPCSRGSGGLWLQQVKAIETNTRGVIYLKGENLINGLTLGSAYWCSLKAPGFKNAGISGTCTKNGWIPNKPQQ
jgi:hypothetical protein